MERRNSPKWATPDRKAHLVSLFIRSQGFCVLGHKPCLIHEHHYEVFIEGLIGEWIADDRAQSEAEWRAERELLHSLSERREPIRGRFSAIAKDIFYSRQPQFYLIGLGISGLTLKPFAKIRLASSFVHLYVDLGDSLKGVSKSKKRKAIRHGKALPKATQESVDYICREAVRHYLTH